MLFFLAQPYRKSVPPGVSLDIMCEHVTYKMRLELCKLFVSRTRTILSRYVGSSRKAFKHTWLFRWVYSALQSVWVCQSAIIYRLKPIRKRNNWSFSRKCQSLGEEIAHLSLPVHFAIIVFVSACMCLFHHTTQALQLHMSKLLVNMPLLHKVVYNTFHCNLTKFDSVCLCTCACTGRRYLFFHLWKLRTLPFCFFF